MAILGLNRYFPDLALRADYCRSVVQAQVCFRSVLHESLCFTSLEVAHDLSGSWCRRRRAEWSCRSCHNALRHVRKAVWDRQIIEHPARAEPA
jgi:hypothetical protein